MRSAFVDRSARRETVEPGSHRIGPVGCALWLVSLLSLPACIIEDGGPPPDQSAVLVTSSCPGGDAIDVTAYAVNDGYLDVTVGYSGGCADHDVWACWDGQFAPSLPPQLYITLGHDAHGDSCEAYITETRRFSLQPVIDANGGSSDFVVRVGP
jgi:hypothetical protein